MRKHIESSAQAMLVCSTLALCAAPGWAACPAGTAFIAGRGCVANTAASAPELRMPPARSGALLTPGTRPALRAGDGPAWRPPTELGSATPAGGAEPAPTAAVRDGVIPTHSAQRPVIARAFRAVPIEPVVFQVLASQKSPPNADLRPRISALGLAVRQQGSRPTCSVHAMTFLLEFMYSTRLKLNFHNLSEEYLNYAANLVTGKNVDGDYFSNLDLGYQKWGIYPESLVPYKAAFDPKFKVAPEYMDVAKKWERFQPEFIKAWDNATGATMGHLHRTMIHLEGETPVAVGMWWPISLKTSTINGVPIIVTPKARDVDAKDGHSVVLVGYRKDPAFPGGGYFIFRNSGGPGWGDKGYGYVSFEYLLAYANDLLAYRQ